MTPIGYSSNVTVPMTLDFLFRQEDTQCDYSRDSTPSAVSVTQYVGEGEPSDYPGGVIAVHSGVRKVQRSRSEKKRKRCPGQHGQK